ncbi:hypothetical protein V8G54_001270 [Vigna mungo]|uniref:Uncharacterized protein n=1 Tax=Vigna mungo TaxID=3915 RepID=A0AAQ3SBC3_VIGMU
MVVVGCTGDANEDVGRWPWVAFLGGPLSSPRPIFGLPVYFVFVSHEKVAWVAPFFFFNQELRQWEFCSVHEENSFPYYLRWGLFVALPVSDLSPSPFQGGYVL